MTIGDASVLIASIGQLLAGVAALLVAAIQIRKAAAKSQSEDAVKKSSNAHASNRAKRAWLASGFPAGVGLISLAWVFIYAVRSDAVTPWFVFSMVMGVAHGFFYLWMAVFFCYWSWWQGAFSGGDS